MRPYNTRNARRGRFSQQQRQILPQRWCAFDEKVRDMMRGLYGMRKKRQHFLESLMGLLPCPYWCYLLPKVTVKGSILLGSNWPWGFGSLVKLPLWEGSWSTTYLLNIERTMGDFSPCNLTLELLSIFIIRCRPHGTQSWCAKIGNGSSGLR